jgi:hypothetical protein
MRLASVVLAPCPSSAAKTRGPRGQLLDLRGERTPYLCGSAVARFDEDLTVAVDVNCRNSWIAGLQFFHPGKVKFA